MSKQIKTIEDTIHRHRDARNRFHIPQRPWRRWDALARITFNALYSAMMDRPDVFIAPGVTAPKTRAELKRWSVTAYNAAWFAADELNIAIKAQAKAARAAVRR